MIEKQLTFLSGKKIYPPKNVPFQLFNIPTTLVNRKPAVLIQPEMKSIQIALKHGGSKWQSINSLQSDNLKQLSSLEKGSLYLTLYFYKPFEHAIQLL